MTNNFIEEYKELQEIRKACDQVRTDEERLEARKVYARFKKRIITEKGTEYAKAFRLFTEAWDKGNNYIDFNDTLKDEEVPKFVETLRSLGFRKFTFSSSWSGAVETAWAFIKNGCLLEGMIEINGEPRDIFSDEYEKIHAFLFNLN